MPFTRKPTAVAAALAMSSLDPTNVGCVSAFAGIHVRF
jgi:hypothetical protein